MKALVLALLVAGTVAASGGAPSDDRGLVARARAEGSLSLYGSISQPQITAIAKRFEAEFGIPVQTLRADNGPIVGRIMTELRAGKPNVDAITLPGFDTYELEIQGVLAAYQAPESRELLAGTADPSGFWASGFLNTETIAYNPVRAKALGLKPPVTWEDFAAKEWRGQFGMYAAGFGWFAAMQRFYGPQRAQLLARAYAANQPQLISSHTLAVNQTAAGEIVGDVNAYGYDVLEAKSKGQPIELVNPNPTVIELLCVAVAKAAPHPNAARLFERWFLSRPTQLWVRDELKRISARKDVKNNPLLLDPKVHYVISNPSDSADSAAVVKQFNAIFNVPG